MQEQWVNDLEGRLRRHLDKGPSIDATAWVHARATVIGDVTLGAQSSIWPGAVLRGDIHRIEVGEGSNVQDGAVVHLADDYPAIIGRYVTVGHLAMVHACEIGDECLVGMCSTILDGAKIGPRCIIAAKALVPPGMEVPAGSMVMGVPGKITRTLSEEEQSGLRYWAEKYVANARAWQRRGL